MTDVETSSRAPEDGRRRLVLAAAGSVLVGGVMVLAGGSTLFPLLGWYLISSVAISTLIVAAQIDRALPVAIVVGAMFLAGDAVQRPNHEEPFHQRHDGAVLATEAAARMTVEGVNPYTADFTPVLRPHHHTLDAVDNPIANPVVEHYPYLPAAFLVHVPFIEMSDATGGWYDPRLLYVAITALAVFFLARGPLAPFRRGAAVWALMGSGTIAIYLSWGANDTAAAALVVIAALVADRRPILAGIALALAISFKALLVVALLPLLVLWWFTNRRVVGPVLAAGAATGLVTSLPFLIAAPRALLDDVVLFNLGMTEMTFPVSGLGLGSHFPGIFQGWLLILSSAVLVAGAATFAIWWVRRCPHAEVALFAAGVIVFAGLIPARTFQQTYAPLMVVLWAPLWRLPASAMLPWRASPSAAQPPSKGPGRLRTTVR